MARWLLAPLLLALASAERRRHEAATDMNPIRKVVNLLQGMQKKIQEEADKEKELFEKYLCYCKNAGGDLQTAISTAEAKGPQLTSEIKAAEAQLVQLNEELKQHQVDRDAAKSAIEEATSLREKEAKLYAEESATHKADISALEKAIAAISKGMAGGFLQTEGAKILKGLLGTQEMLETDRQIVLAFLSGGQGLHYSPKSGEVVGILQEMLDNMKKTLADMTAEEKEAIANYQDLMAAKEREVSTLIQSIETKQRRVGELGVEIVQKKDDLADSEEALMENKKFLADLSKSCGTKQAEWDERVKTRGQELQAIAETIEILNSDDALDLFKKTLPSPGASFVQVHNSNRQDMQRMQALQVLKEAEKLYAPRVDMDFLAMALQGRKVGLDKVMKMIDNMVANLKQEQSDDEHKKEYCSKQLDISEDELKSLERGKADLETAMVEAEEAIGTTKEEIKTLEKTIKDLDKTVAEATEQRKAEHEEFTELIASDSAAKELLGMAKNRLKKFYQPSQHVPESSAEPAAAFAAVSAHLFHKQAPPPPPETFGSYNKQSEGSGGVLGMLDTLIRDLDKEITEAEVMEENSQKEYEGMMKDSEEKRADSSKSLTLKAELKASLETDVEEHKEKMASTEKEIGSMVKYMSSLHADCDWLLKYFDVRTEARSGEIDALNKAKAILSGADFGLLETKAKGVHSK